MVWARAAVLAHYGELARSVGLDPYRMLARFRIRPEQLRNPDERIDGVAVALLLEESAQRADCPEFGILLAERRELGLLGPTGLLLQQQETLEATIRTLIRYQHLLSGMLALSFEQAGEAALLRFQFVLRADFLPRQAHEYAVALYCNVLRELGGWAPESAHFVHPAPPGLEAHQRVLGCPLFFEDEFNGLVYSAEALAARNPAVHASLAAYANSYFEALLPDAAAGSVTQRARRAIYALLPSGRASIEQVAAQLGLGARTLQRRLAEEGGSFSDVLAGARRELVVRHLLNPAHRLGTIAEMMGYSSPGAFTRWFAAEFGMSPSAWRRRVQEEALAAEAQPAAPGPVSPPALLR